MPKIHEKWSIKSSSQKCEKIYNFFTEIWVTAPNFGGRGFKLRRILCYQFLSSAMSHTDSPPTYHDLFAWLNFEQVRNPNVIHPFLVNGPLLTAFLLRAGIRCGNDELYYSAYEYVSLLTFINNNTNYQLLYLFEHYTLAVAPDIIKKFILE